jgi:hypothetical protein
MDSHNEAEGEEGLNHKMFRVLKKSYVNALSLFLSRTITSSME